MRRARGLGKARCSPREAMHCALGLRLGPGAWALTRRLQTDTLFALPRISQASLAARARYRYRIDPALRRQQPADDSAAQPQQTTHTRTLWPGAQPSVACRHLSGHPRAQTAGRRDLRRGVNMSAPKQLGHCSGSRTHHCSTSLRGSLLDLHPRIRRSHAPASRSCHRIPPRSVQDGVSTTRGPPTSLSCGQPAGQPLFSLYSTQCVAHRHAPFWLLVAATGVQQQPLPLPTRRTAIAAASACRAMAKRRPLARRLGCISATLSCLA